MEIPLPDYEPHDESVEYEAQELLKSGQPVPASWRPRITCINLKWVAPEALHHVGALDQLKELYLEEIEAQDLSFLSALRNLETLSLFGLPVSDIGPLASLTSLKKLTLIDLPTADLTPLSALAGLKDLTINLDNAHNLGPLSSLGELESLDLSGMTLISLEPLAHIYSLKLLKINPKLIGIIDVSSLGALSNLHISTEIYSAEDSIHRIEQYPESWNPFKRRLYFDKRERLNGLDFLARFTNLETLVIDNSRGYSVVNDLSPLAGLAKLKEMICHYTRIRDFGPLSALHQLESLNLGFDEGYGPTSLVPLKDLLNLRELTLGPVPTADLTPLSGLRSLRKLDLSFAKGVSPDLTPLRGLQELEVLSLSASDISDLSPLAALKRSEIDLSLWHMQNLDALRSLANPESLKSLWIQGVASDLSPLESLTGLTYLSVDVEHIDGLPVLSRLRELMCLCIECSSLADVSPLSSLREDCQIVFMVDRAPDLAPLGSRQNVEVVIRRDQELDEEPSEEQLESAAMLEEGGIMEYEPGKDKDLDALVLLSSAMKCFDGREYDKAIEYYTVAMQITTKHADVFRNLRADAYKEQGNYHRALADYDEAITLNPANVTAHIGRGDLFERMGDRLRATADFRKALALNPDMLPQSVRECEDALKRLATTH